MITRQRATAYRETGFLFDQANARPALISPNVMAPGASQRQDLLVTSPELECIGDHIFGIVQRNLETAPAVG